VLQVGSAKVSPVSKAAAREVSPSPQSPLEAMVEPEPEPEPEREPEREPEHEALTLATSAPERAADAGNLRSMLREARAKRMSRGDVDGVDCTADDVDVDAMRGELLRLRTDLAAAKRQIAVAACNDSVKLAALQAQLAVAEARLSKDKEKEKEDKDKSPAPDVTAAVAAATATMSARHDAETRALTVTVQQLRSQLAAAQMDEARARQQLLDAVGAKELQLQVTLCGTRCLCPTSPHIRIEASRSSLVTPSPSSHVSRSPSLSPICAPTQVIFLRVLRHTSTIASCAQSNQ
jgi:hypothetical protein